MNQAFPRYLACLFVCFACLFTVGCGAQTLTVMVERIEPDDMDPPGTSIVIDPAYVEATIKSIEALGRFQALAEHVKQSASTRPGIMQATSTLSTGQSEASTLRDEGQAILEKLAALSTPSYAKPSKPKEASTQPADSQQIDLRKTAIQLRLFPARVLGFLHRTRSSTDELFKSSVARQWEESYTQIELLAAQGAKKAAAPAFGGFTSNGVFQISPGDPAYSRVLKGHVVGEPISDVYSVVEGDSTILFVQESPAQMRVFSVDMDATRLVQNIVYIGDKALEAAVKSIAP